jgi:hypothetical protein
MTPIARTWGCHGTLHAFVYDKKTNDEFLDAVAEHNALVDAYEELKARNTKLVAIVDEIFQEWPENNGYDGLQELGEKHGILVPEQRTEYCGEHCFCALYDAKEGTEPFTCYRNKLQSLTTNTDEAK